MWSADWERQILYIEFFNAQNQVANRRAAGVLSELAAQSPERRRVFELRVNSWKQETGDLYKYRCAALSSKLLV